MDEGPEVEYEYISMFCILFPMQVQEEVHIYNHITTSKTFIPIYKTGSLWQYRILGVKGHLFSNNICHSTTLHLAPDPARQIEKESLNQIQQIFCPNYHPKGFAQAPA